MPQAKPSEIKTLPAYTIAEAARFIGSHPETLRIWFKGRRAYKGKDRARRAIDPLLRKRTGGDQPLSFIELVEAHIVHTVRRGYKIPMKNVRTAISYLEEIQGDLVFIASRDFCHDRKHIFLKISERLISLSERGQLVDPDIIAEGLRQLAYGNDGYADRFFPSIKGQIQKDFAFNPAVNFGRLSIARLGVGADALAARFLAGEKISSISQDYNASPDEVEEAIRWHERLAA